MYIDDEGRKIISIHNKLTGEVVEIEVQQDYETDEFFYSEYDSLGTLTCCLIPTEEVVIKMAEPEVFTYKRYIDK